MEVGREVPLKVGGKEKLQVLHLAQEILEKEGAVKVVVLTRSLAPTHTGNLPSHKYCEFRTCTNSPLK